MHNKIYLLYLSSTKTKTKYFPFYRVSMRIHEDLGVGLIPRPPKVGHLEPVISKSLLLIMCPSQNTDRTVWGGVPCEMV